MGQAQTSHTLDLFYATLGNDGFVWTCLKDVTAGKLGWIRDDLLNWTGTLQGCGF